MGSLNNLSCVVFKIEVAFRAVSVEEIGECVVKLMDWIGSLCGAGEIGVARLP